MQAVTGYKDGWLVIIELEPMDSEPTMQALYWPITRSTLTELKDMDYLDKEVRYEGSGVYSVRLAPYSYQRLNLIDGGSTKPLVVERYAIPQPKVRKGIQLRWKNSRWEKLLKTGWTIA